jgi:hypothetical protein
VKPGIAGFTTSLEMHFRITVKEQKKLNVFAITLASKVQFSEKLQLVENRLSEKSKQTGLHYLKRDLP